MRSRRASTTVLLGTSAFLLSIPPVSALRAQGAGPGVTVRLEAIDAAPARAAPIRPMPIMPLRAGSPRWGQAMLGRSGLPQSGTAQIGLPQSGTAQMGLPQIGTARMGLPLNGLAQSGLPLNGAGQGESARGGPARSRMALSGAARGTAGHGALTDETSAWTPALEPLRPAVDAQSGWLQCVPYARMISGIGIHGDAWTWWDKASGVYARGSHPEPGAVLSFPGIERMPLGHVAVVSHVLGARKILIEHANWPTAEQPHGAISTEIVAMDTSPANDWTEVRVQFGKGGPLGSAYPTNGFIYGWSETGARIARPSFSLDYALWSPVTPSWRMFNPIAYSWALPKAARPKAYAAMIAPTPRPVVLASALAGGRPSLSTAGKPSLVLGPVGPGLAMGALGQPIAINRLTATPRMGANHFVLQ